MISIGGKNVAIVSGASRLALGIMVTTFSAAGWAAEAPAGVSDTSATAAAAVESPATAPSGVSRYGEDAGSHDDNAIIVSARRREESAQDVPIALSVIGANALQQSGSYSLGQVQQLVPSLQVFSFNPRNTNINIRGLGSNVALTNDGLENGVGFYIDNVFYGRVGQSQFDLVDLAQIEVLRGPQGTLFGKNTTAGAINISSKKPVFDSEFSGEASVGDYGYYQLRGSASGGLIDDLLAVRLSGAVTERRGFLYNVTQKERAQDHSNWSVRGQLLLTPSADLSIRMIGDFARQRQNHVLNVIADYFGTYDNGAVIPNNFEAIAARFPGYQTPAIAPFSRLGYADSHYQSQMDGYGVSGQVDWTLGKHVLTSITAHRWWDWDPANDSDGTSLSYLTKNEMANRQRQFSQELRLASDGTGDFNYVLGAYYYWQVIRGYGATAYGDVAARWAVPTQPSRLAELALNGFESQIYSQPTTKSFALFGQGDWKFSEALTLTAGLRWTREKKHGIFRQFHAKGADISSLSENDRLAVIGLRNRFHAPSSYETGFTDESLSGLATLSWKIDRNALIYGTYSRGNKSGGLNLTNLPAGIDPDVAPEKVDAFEIGSKSQWLDQLLTFNLAAYYTKVKDYQAAVTDQINNVNGRQYIANIPSVKTKGIEADVVLAPSQRVQFTASAAYADAVYDEYPNAPQAIERANLGPIQDLSGQQLAGVPKFTYSLGADTSAPLGTLGAKSLSLYGHIDYAHRSAFNTSASNSRYAIINPYGIANARIGIKTDDGFFDLSVWARNLFNEEYFQTLSPTNTGLVTSLIGEPRTWGLTIRSSL
jgi:iron complex outermembrane receptor protein